MGSEERIAIFQAEHSLQVHTLNLVQALIGCGFGVDLFLFRCTSSFADMGSSGATVYDLTPIHPGWDERSGSVAKLIAALKYFVIDSLSPGKDAVLPSSVVQESIRHLSGGNYRCFIGVEKVGLIWAGLMAERMGRPSIYYSLELYPMTMAFQQSGKLFPVLKAPRFIRTKFLEAYFHRKTIATIVQDDLRADELYRYNRVSRSARLFLPVSLPKRPPAPHGDYFHKVLSLPPGKKVVLMFGQITAKRLIPEIVVASQGLPDDWEMVFHGPVGERGILERITALDERRKVHISTAMVPEKQLDAVIASADIGLCLYKNELQNDVLAGFSSEKLTRYVMNGIPVIAFDYPSFIESVRETGCGVCIRDVLAIPSAVEEIAADLPRFGQHAVRTFERYFDFTDQVRKVIAFIQSIPGTDA